MITQAQVEMLKYYNAGLVAYKQRKWNDAIRFFTAALEKYPEDGPSKLYLERVVEYSKNPPPDDWDGVFTMTTK